MDTRSYKLLDAQLGAMTQGEVTLAGDLQLPGHSFTILDRAYFPVAFLLDWQARSEDCRWLMRVRHNLRDMCSMCKPRLTTSVACRSRYAPSGRMPPWRLGGRHASSR